MDRDRRLRLQAFAGLVIIPVLVWLWPPGTASLGSAYNRYLVVEDLCPENQPRTLDCEKRRWLDADLWAHGYSPRGYNPYKQLPLMPTQ
jgi:hypothetical protein